MNRSIYLALTVLSVAIAACDGGSGTDTVESSISGSVTIEGTGASDVTVSLSTGDSTATDASGNYGFSNVPDGSYVVSITRFPSDAIFSTTSQPAVVPEGGAAINVNFSGSFTRNSDIVGAVAVANIGPLEGADVTLGGVGSATTMTDAAGQYAFSALRTGEYTVTISGFDTLLYAFPNTSQTVTVGPDAREVVNFDGTLGGSSAISGALFLDENPKDNMFNGETDESLLAAADVKVILKGPNVGEVQETMTDAEGRFLFEHLLEGTYSAGINLEDTNLPSFAAFGGDTMDVLVTVGTGSSGEVYFPFDVVQQTVSACVFTGLDGLSPGHNPVADGVITLYPLESDAIAMTNAFGTQTTDATGCTDFTFDRTNDTSPQPGFRDNIVFATITGTPLGNYFLNGESRIEIGYDPTTAFSLAPDTFDVQSATVTLAWDPVTTAGDTLRGWNWSAWTDTTSANIATGVTDSVSGAAYVGLNSLGIAVLPRTIYTRLNRGAGQPAALGRSFPQTPLPIDTAAATVPEHLVYVQDGFNIDGDTVWIGRMEVVWP